jgi:hypothetical protein
MKIFGVLAGMIVLAVMLAPASSAQVPLTETTVWMEDSTSLGTWPDSLKWDPGDINAMARLWHRGSSIDSACNKKYWRVKVDIYASIGQWIEWTLNHQGWEWKVKKPGCYAGNSITFQIATNGDVKIDYQEFNDLQALVPGNHKTYIDTWYSWGESVTDAETHGWVRAPLLNDDDDILIEQDWYGTLIDPFVDNIHYGLAFKLWSKICVDRCNTACEYHDDAYIQLELLQQKPWLDDNGDWVDLVLP